MKRESWLVAVGLTATVALAHGGAINGDFHYDDKVSVTENLAIRQWQPWFYLTSPLAATSEPGAQGYRPLTVATFALNYSLGGLNPSGYLLTNLLLHLAVCWLMFLVGRLLLRSDLWAGIAALIYAVHPINAEAVNYVVARSSLLATSGALIAYWAFLRRSDGGAAGWMIVGTIAWMGALLSKEAAAAAILPLMISPWLVQTAPPSPSRSNRAAEWWPRVSGLIPYLMVLIVYLTIWWNMAGTQIGQQARTAAYPMWTVLEIVGRSLMLWVWPHPLGLDHPLVFVTAFDVATAAWLIVGLAVLGGTLVVCWRRAPLAAWCLVWTSAGLAVLAPLPWMTVKGLMQENRMTFSAVGLAWLTVIVMRAAGAALERAVLERRSARLGRLVRGLAIAVIVAGLAVAVAVDRARSAVWADDVRLWQEVVARSPSRSAYTNLGAGYMARGDYERAEEAMRQAVAVAPNDAFPYYALGALAFQREDYDYARMLFLKTASLAPDYARTYRMLGIIAIKQNRDDDAAVFLRRAAMLDPRDAGALANLGLVAQRAGDDAAAMRFYREAIGLDPGQPLARNNLGTLYLKEQRWADALAQFSALLERAPDDYDAALNRAAALNALGRKEEARKALEALLSRLPADPKFDAHRRGATLILSRLSP